MNKVTATHITLILSLFLLMGLMGCSKTQPVKRPAVRPQTAAEEVLRIGLLWNSSIIEKGILSAPSPVSFFRNRRTSILQVSENQVKETLEINEELELRDGQRIQCTSRFNNSIDFRWLRTHGEAALELRRPRLKLKRNCSGKVPEQELVEPENRVLLVLRGDQLVAIKPKVDDRVYIPTD